MTDTRVQPNLKQLRALSLFERSAFGISNFVNSHEIPKSVAQGYLRRVGATWVYGCIRNLVHVHGLNHLRDLQPEAGLLLVSNHRSFFDQFVLSSVLFRKTHLLERLYFPVRAEFFYESFLGLFLSSAIAGLAMYPPIFREASKREFNAYSVKRLVELLQQRGTVVGIHPEGTRNKGDDPYSLLKAQHGVGRIIMGAKPTVVPVFLNGLSNDFLRQVGRNFNGASPPIIIVIGQPIDLGEFYAEPSKLRTYKIVSDCVLEEIFKLGGQEREYRREIETSPIRGPMFY